MRRQNVDHQNDETPRKRQKIIITIKNPSLMHIEKHNIMSHVILTKKAKANSTL